VPDAQIFKPQTPDSASTRPDAQKTCAARNVFKKEFIKRQQQFDFQRRLASIGIAGPTKTHRYPPSAKSDSVACGILSILVYRQQAVNNNDG
jgi:hypothetical protein